MAGELELVLTDEAHLLPLTHALRAGWITAPCAVRWVTPAEVVAAAGSPQTVALVAPQAYAPVAASHTIVAETAVAASFHSTIALAGARRPDSLESVEIDARDVTDTVATLARILGAQHFGAVGWRITREPAPGAPARLLEGDAALMALAEMEAVLTETYRRAPQAETSQEDGEDDDEAGDAQDGTGYAEDLGRAWFVLTGLPWVSHVLLAPRAAAAQPDELKAIVSALQAAVRMGREQEAVIVAEAAARLGAPTGIVRRLFQARSYRLGVEERKTLDRFFQRAARFAGLPPVPEVAITEVSGQ